MGDFLVHDSKFWVFTTGWQEDMDADEFIGLMHELKFYPNRVVRHWVEADRSSAFFMTFDDMFITKKAMSRLRRLKHRWRMKREMAFMAYPRRIDVYRAHKERYEDEDSADESDIDEPVIY